MIGNLLTQDIFIKKQHCTIYCDLPLQYVWVCTGFLEYLKNHVIILSILTSTGRESSINTPFKVKGITNYSIIYYTVSQKYCKHLSLQSSRCWWSKHSETLGENLYFCQVKFINVTNYWLSGQSLCFGFISMIKVVHWFNEWNWLLIE